MTGRYGEPEFLTDQELLAFDRSKLADGDTVDFEQQLGEYGDRYRDHLMIANWIAGWEHRLSERRPNDPDWDAAFRSGLRQVTAHLRQGDFLPGRAFYARFGSE